MSFGALLLWLVSILGLLFGVIFLLSALKTWFDLWLGPHRGAITIRERDDAIEFFWYGVCLIFVFGIGLSFALNMPTHPHIPQ